MLQPPPAPYQGKAARFDDDHGGLPLDPLERALSDLKAAELLRARAVLDLALVKSELARLDREHACLYDEGELANAAALERRIVRLRPLLPDLVALERAYGRGALAALRRANVLVSASEVRRAA